MAHYTKSTKHPLTGQFEPAAWLDMGTFYYVAFPDGRWYHEKYTLWECQASDDPGTPDQTASKGDAVPTGEAA
jgi:hypothetical protein